MKLGKFIKGVVAEMKVVRWPTAKENRFDTSTVVLTSLFFIIFFAFFDWIIQLFLGVLSK